MLLHKLYSKASPYLFFIKFLLSFFILYLFFPFYWGLTGIGGTLYSPFLDHHLNVIKGLTVFLTGCAKYILEALHYTVKQPNYYTLRIGYSRGINVNPSCLGWGVMSFWVAFVFANYGSLKHKLKWTLLGITSICILNITRIVLIAVASHLHWKTITSLDHHQTFNVFSYGCIFIFMYLYISFQKKYEENLIQHQQQNKKITTV